MARSSTDRNGLGEVDSQVIMSSTTHPPPPASIYWYFISHHVSHSVFWKCVISLSLCVKSTSASTQTLTPIRNVLLTVVQKFTPWNELSVIAAHDVWAGFFCIMIKVFTSWQEMKPLSGEVDWVIEKQIHMKALHFQTYDHSHWLSV